VGGRSASPRPAWLARTAGARWGPAMEAVVALIRRGSRGAASLAPRSEHPSQDRERNGGPAGPPFRDPTPRSALLGAGPLAGRRPLGGPPLRGALLGGRLLGGPALGRCPLRRRLLGGPALGRRTLRR